MDTGYVRAEADQPTPDTSPAEETAELLLLTAGEPTGPVSLTWEQEPGNI